VGVTAVLLGTFLLGVAPMLQGCSNTAGDKPATTPAPGGDAGTDAETFNVGHELRVTVPASGRVYVRLAPPSVVTPTDPKATRDWDIAFEGLDVFTNSGPSGPAGGASGFGPLDAVVFLEDTAPQVPFLSQDKTGGAFVRWWFYAGAPSHALYSRMHVFGVKDQNRLFKVQVLNYYAERQGAPVSALYAIRYAEVLPTGIGPTVELNPPLDGTAGGTSGGVDAPGECVDLTNGARAMLSPSAARTSNAWSLCFRRQDISVNGEQGGPRGVGAIDLNADRTAVETLTEVQNRTPDTERPKFDAVDNAALQNQPFRGDRIVSAFSDLWLERGTSPATPRKVAWYVVGADGKQKFLVGFARFENATDKSPGTIVMRVKAVE
jgi:hypothetical protein